MKIKICGLMNLTDISYINEAMPDYIGFIFAKKSKRRISFDNALEMKRALNTNIKSVGVFVDEEPENIAAAAKAGIIDLIQLHGTEDNAYILNLKQKTGKTVIKAFRPDEYLENNINSTSADYVLIDSADNNTFGGTGKTFNWGLIPQKTNKKIFLAGGLNSINVLQAIQTAKPYCVDINSGVETDGKKDKNKILEIIQIIKGYRNE